MKDNIATKIVLITSGQPAVNPRLVKEADSLADAGYDVTVVYQYWNDWATACDAQMLPAKKWKSIIVGGSPHENKFSFWLSRVRHKINNLRAVKVGFGHGVAEGAIGRCTQLLFKVAAQIPADIYIAHNLAALPAAVKAAKKNGAKCGFDAEDFHRNEVEDDPAKFDVRLKTYIEDKYLPQLDYVTTSSDQITARYKQLYPAKDIVTLLNVFPQTHVPEPAVKNNNTLKLFWFSQTIGAGRGLEDVISAMRAMNKNVELHLLGQPAADYKTTLLNHAGNCGVNSSAIHFYPPVPPDDVFKMAVQFDIGIATEAAIPLNRDICLTNKIFTYLQCGLAIVASNTTAQASFLRQYTKAGKLYTNYSTASLAECLVGYINDAALLQKTKLYNYQLGQSALNWEVESRKLLAIIKEVLHNHAA